MLELKEIPYDLEELLDADDIMYMDSKRFEDAMLSHGLFECGSIRRSHRIVTEKAKKLGYFGVIELLTGLSEEAVNAVWAEETKADDIKKLNELAEQYGYSLIPIVNDAKDLERLRDIVNDCEIQKQEDEYGHWVEYYDNLDDVIERPDSYRIIKAIW